MEETRPPLTLGKRVRDKRRELGITQRDLAEKVKIDFTYLSKVENDRGDPPSDETIVRIARGLDLDELELLSLAGKVPSTVRDLAAEDPEFAMFLRKLPDLPKADREALYRRVEEKE
jgi:transcriptional regulator with XRE-family HTH domain